MDANPNGNGGDLCTGGHILSLVSRHAPPLLWIAILPQRHLSSFLFCHNHLQQKQFCLHSQTLPAFASTTAKDGLRFWV